VGDDVHAGVLDGAQDPGRHDVAGLAEGRVHGRDDDVEAGEEVRVPVEGAIGLDVELGAVQQGDAADRSSRRIRSRCSSAFWSVMRCM